MQTAVHSRCPVGVPSLQSTLRRTQRPARAQRPFLCSAQQPRDQQPQSTASTNLLPVTAALAAAFLISAGTPDEALAARSGGRVGGSSFRSARPAPAPRGGGGGGGGGGQAGPTIRNYNYHSYSAPPVYGGYGPSYGFGGGGISIMPSFGVPLIGGGGFFSLIFGLFAISLVLNVAKNLTSRGRDRDDFD